jgi:hypothetical protein
LIANIAAWLKPDGMFVASFGSGAASEWTGEWLGTTMFFGHNSEAETLRCLADSGLRVRDSSVEKQDNEAAALMWIEAVKDRYPPDRKSTVAISKEPSRQLGLRPECANTGRSPTAANASN